MITLEVESYCHKCDQFEPTAERRLTLRFVTFFGNVDEEVEDRAVVCTNHDRCRAIEQAIRREIEAKEGEK